MEEKKKKDGKRNVLPPRDERFVEAMRNPVFRRVPRREKKVDIDKRFQSMFHDKQFKLKSKVDKRGRPIDLSTDEDLRKYYHLVEDEDDEVKAGSKVVDGEEGEEPNGEGEEGLDGSSSEEDSQSDNENEVEVEGNVKEADIGKLDTKVKLSKILRKKIRSSDVDYARGEGHLVDEESSDDSSSTEEEDGAEDTAHAWGELDRDAPRTDEASRRLALCNMDWDRLKALDLMVLFHSFLPPGGVLKHVKIYTSEYGKQRLADEDVHGPLELREPKLDARNSDVSDNEDDVPDDEEERSENEDNDAEDEEGGGYHMERLRQYQLNRLKYFYAVLEFDSVEAAEKIYSECDGMEYESSATRVDLRYVPDDMTFDDEPKDSCDSLPQAEKYRPRFFTTTALQQAKVDLTWDETDPLRKELTQRIYDPKEKVDDEDIQAYLASSSDSEEELEGEGGSDEERGLGEDSIAKYRALLGSLEETEKSKKDKDVEMEVTWGVGLKKKTESLVKKRLEEKTAKDLTPWEEMLAKKREKKKLKRGGKKESTEGEDGDGEVKIKSEDESSDEEGGQLFSDDEVDVDMSDPFFRDEIASNEVHKGAKKSSKKKNQNGIQLQPSDKKGIDNAALELLLMDGPVEEHKHHFSLKKILQNESESKSKKKRKKNKRGGETAEMKAQVQDNFEVNVTDDRFGALFSSHLYNVDPSDPNFKKTKGMDAIITEKQKRRLVNPTDDKTRDSWKGETSEPKVSRKSELSYLVKSVKRNAVNFKKQPNKK